VTDKVVVLVTAASKKECRKIASHLVESKLAACVNITQRIESVYRWKGKIASDKEFQLFIKTTRELSGNQGCGFQTTQLSHPGNHLPSHHRGLAQLFAVAGGFGKAGWCRGR